MSESPRTFKDYIFLICFAMSLSWPLLLIGESESLVINILKVILFFVNMWAICEIIKNKGNFNDK